jgi:predicted DNA-binding protein with PD1-like motif
MKLRKDAYNWLARLERGETLDDLKTALTNENIRSGVVVGIGACQWAELGFYDLKSKNYQWQKFDKPMEVLGITGNVSLKNGEVFLHLHGSFSDKDFKTVGGHVKNLEVAGTLEIFLHDWFADPISRKIDQDTGLNLLDI